MTCLKFNINKLDVFLCTLTSILTFGPAVETWKVVLLVDSHFGRFVFYIQSMHAGRSNLIVTTVTLYVHAWCRAILIVYIGAMCDENLHFTSQALPQTGSNAYSSSPASVEAQPSTSRVPLPRQSAVQLPSFVFEKSSTSRIPRKVTVDVIIYIWSCLHNNYTT